MLSAAAQEAEPPAELQSAAFIIPTVMNSKRTIIGSIIAIAIK